MTVLLDSSGLFAYLSASDENHGRAVTAFGSLKDEQRLIHSYVLLETEALVRARLGAQASRRLHGDLVPALEIEWVTEALHTVALSAMLAAGRRDLSLVDCVSFEVMRRRGIDTAFAFDDDFVTAGFRVIP